MKLKLKTIILFIVILCTSSCNKNDPKPVAESFLAAMFRLDFEKAKTYGTDDTNKLLDIMAGFAKMMPDSAKRVQIKFKILRENIDGDKATVTYKEDDKGEEKTIPLVMENGNWKVSIGKDLMNSTMEEGNEASEDDSTPDSTPADSSK